MENIKFKDFITLQRGFDLPKSKRRKGVYPIVASTSIQDYHEEYKVLPPGVTTGRSGALGEVIYVNQPFWPLNTSLWVKDFKGNHPRYVYYFLKTLNLKRFNSGAGVPTLNRNHLDNLEINLNKVPTQKKISSILSTYDDLIENNTRRIAILEEMGQMIYREWFVKFRFPGHEKVKMIDSAFGKIPVGWEVKVLGDIAEQIKRTLKPHEIDDDSPYIGLEHLPRKSIALSDWGRGAEISSNKFGFKAGEILFGKIRPYFHKVGVAPIDGVCSTDAIVINSKDEKFFPFTLCCVSSEEFVRQATQTSNGVKMPRANWELLLEYPIFIPEKDLFDSFSAIVRNIVSNIMSMILKNRNLRQTRDLLLPKLISSELDVSGLDIDIPEIDEPELQASDGGMK
jgi:type I restriction enzyme, S subunit